MRFLFIHQNFPGQFRHLAPHLQALGHQVQALAIGGQGLPGVPLQRHQPQAAGQPPGPTGTRIGLGRMQTDLQHAESAFVAMLQLKSKGFEPDVVVAHPGWGEHLFVEQAWPGARRLLYAEYFFHTQGADFGFDREWSRPTPWDEAALTLRNWSLSHALMSASGGWTPTRWQHSLLPHDVAHKYKVVFDGVNTDVVKPAQGVQLNMHSGTVLRQGDEVITFVNRNLEPARGFHILMRALPRILRERPHARVVIVGGNDVSYGQPPPPIALHHLESGKQQTRQVTWREYMLAELAQRGEHLPMERVHFMGKVPYEAYVKLLQLSACHVYLSYPFVLGWSCFEALSAGALVVGSDTASVKELIEHERNGLLVNFFDHQALAAQVVDVLDKPKRYAHLRLAARNTILQGSYTLKTCLDEQTRIVCEQ